MANEVDRKANHGVILAPCSMRQKLGQFVQYDREEDEQHYHGALFECFALLREFFLCEQKLSH